MNRLKRKLTEKEIKKLKQTKKLVKEVIQQSMNDDWKRHILWSDDKIIDFIIDYFYFDDVPNLNKSYILEKIYDVELIELSTWDVEYGTYTVDEMMINYLTEATKWRRLTLEKYLEKALNANILGLVKHVNGESNYLLFKRRNK